MDGVLRWMGLFPEREHRIVRIIGWLCRGLRICTLGFPALANGLLDNTNVVAWLTKRRAPSPIVCAVVAAIERVKYELILKISTRYISTQNNKTADRLSRGHIPTFLYTRGARISPPMKAICANLHLENIEKLWVTTIKNSPLPTQV